MTSRTSPTLPPSYLVKYISGKWTYNSDPLGATIIQGYIDVMEQAKVCQSELESRCYYDDVIHVECYHKDTQHWYSMTDYNLDDVISDLLVL